MILSVLALVLTGLSVAGAVFWVLVAHRSRLVVVHRPTVREGLALPAPPGDWPTLSIVVPVHNEEHHIDECAARLREQVYDKLELVFVLDRCTDGTAQIIAGHAEADPRITLVENDLCPEDWAGKCYAAHLGAERATGDWLLFTDADTLFDPNLARASVAMAVARGLDLLSLLSTLTYEHLFEQIAQPVATFRLMCLYPIEKINRAERPRPFANGQFMLFRREAYERMGGHAAVKDALLEDIAAARLIQINGGRGAIAFADGMLVCSMYESLAAFEAGWKRIFIEACNRKPVRLRKFGWRVLAQGVALPVVQLATLAAAVAVGVQGDVLLPLIMTAIVLTGWWAQGAALRRIYRLSDAPIQAAWLYPLGSLIVARVMFAGARALKRRRPLRWGQREYVLEPR